VTNPVMEALISAKVSGLIDPPRSWGHAERVAWLQLPRELQIFYAKREAERARAVRNSQNEAGELRRRLAAAEARIAELEKPNNVQPASADPLKTQPKEIEDGIHKDTAA